MKYLNKSIKSLLTCLVILALGSSAALAAKGGAKVAVSLSASPATLDEGQSATLNWSSSNAISCSASWTGSTATSGSQSVSPGASTTYSISCTDGRKSASDSVTVTVNTVTTPAPTVSLLAAPATIDEGQSATLSWSSTDANSCSASWTTSSATSGSQSVSPAASTTYNISCDGGSANSSATVTVNIASSGYDLVGDYIGGTHDTQVYDTSFAVEFSYSCLTGGCHETDQQLVDEYAAANMTHTMVKCNACHGTHTADTVGVEKPNLTGYYPGIGATGYVVGEDRCKACHNNQHNGGRASKGICSDCHVPHVFAPPNGGSRW